MSYRKGSYQNENVPPLFNTVDRAEYYQEKNMIITCQIRDMLEAQSQVKFKRMHFSKSIRKSGFFY